MERKSRCAQSILILTQYEIYYTNKLLQKCFMDFNSIAAHLKFITAISDEVLILTL